MLYLVPVSAAHRVSDCSPEERMRCYTRARRVPWHVPSPSLAGKPLWSRLLSECRPRDAARVSSARPLGECLRACFSTRLPAPSLLYSPPAAVSPTNAPRARGQHVYRVAAGVSGGRPLPRRGREQTALGGLQPPSAAVWEQTGWSVQPPASGSRRGQPMHVQARRPMPAARPQPCACCEAL
jgi:hypothetical protein